MLARELDKAGRVDLRHFYVRRVRRLLPALAAMLLFVSFVGDLFAPTGAVRTSGFTALFASVFAANAYLYTLPADYYSVSDQLNPLLHTWTLAVEEQFYVLFPLLLVLGWRFGVWRGRSYGRAAASVVIAALTVGSLIAADAWSQGWGHGLIRSPATFAFYASPARAWEFGLGSLVALAVPLLRRVPRLAASAAAAFGVGLTLLACSETQDIGVGVSLFVIPVVGTCCLLIAGTSGPNLISSLLSRRPLVFVGDISYGLYLWHWPFIVFARALAPKEGWVPVAAAAFSVLPAWASHRYVENPIRTNATIVGKRLLALAAVCVLVPIVASVGAIRMAPSADAAILRPHLDRTSHCDSPAPFGDPSRTACLWTVSHSKGQVVLIGDSNAGQFSEPVVSAAERAGYSAYIATFHHCPFNQLATGWAITVECRTFARRSLTGLIQARPSLVIIASRTDLYVGVRSISINKIPRQESFPPECASGLKLFARNLSR